MLAHRIGVSYSQLNRLFRKNLHTSVGRYMAQERLAMARRLLADSNLPIHVIAKMAGFGNPQHFNKFVRKHCGMPPRQFRAESAYSERR